MRFLKLNFENGMSIMNYQECIDYILSIPLFAEKLGTDNLNKILDLMDHPERSYRVIHVAGTNGKGSTCAYLASILRQKGFRVGMFTSPHLIRLNERIRVNNVMIDDASLVDCFNEVSGYVDLAKKKGISHPSFFEFVFLMGVLYFRKQKIDYAIIETGMGGRLDATNVVLPSVCIITSVGMDHMQYLGDTLAEIAAEKAGIIKPGIPVVFFDRKDEATHVIGEICKINGGILHIVEKKQYKLLKITKKSIDFSFESDYYRYDNLKINNMALYQIENAILAIRAYELLTCDFKSYNYNENNNNYNIDIDAIRKGILEMEWPGRMQKIDDRIYVDGAHNEEAIIAFCHTLEMMFPYEHKVLLFAVSKDKDYTSMIKLLSRIRFEKILIVRYHGDRSADIETVKNTFLDAYENIMNDCSHNSIFGLSESSIITFEDMKTGFEYGKQYINETHVEDRILFCVGSLYLVGELLSLGV